MTKATATEQGLRNTGCNRQQVIIGSMGSRPNTSAMNAVVSVHTEMIDGEARLSRRRTPPDSFKRTCASGGVHEVGDEEAVEMWGWSTDLQE